MRLWRNMVVLVSLCLLLGASAAPAAEAPSALAGREAGWIAHVLGRLETFLKAAWENEAGQIDPLGRVSPNSGAPSTDETGEIDPWGRVSPNAGSASTDEAGQIDPWGGSGK